MLLVVTATLGDERPDGVTGETWQFGPLNRWAYSHLRELLPTKDIPNDYRSVRPLPGVGSSADDLGLLVDGNPEQLSAAMERLYVDGVLVIQDGAAVVERYADTLTPERPHLMWSVTKTVTGLAAASVAADGLIDLEKRVADYVPELAASGWAQDRLRDLLDMKDSSDWTEDYDAPDSTVRRQDCADGLLTGEACAGIAVTGNYEFLPNVGRDPERRGRFVYKSGTTDVIAWVLEAATGQRFADLVTDRIWKPIGAERSAYITVDNGGFTLASGGMAATLRDIGRVGLLMLNRGTAGDTRVVPAAWLDDIFGQQGDPHWPGPRGDDAAPYYRSFVWGTGDGAGTVYARGVHGQYIFVSPSTDTVIAMFSSWPNADGGAPGVGHDAAMALLEAIRSEISRPPD
jgi:CubicO group peptidase (beta-lactamase class C family)